jgi:curved DNA-binding protein CbpA
VADYYQILGLPHTATCAQIRTAYKRLAMQYHPDRNPGNAMAEEIIKQINEAYDVLSDPVKKSRYDLRFTAHQTYQPNTRERTEAYWREIRRQHHQARATQPPPEKSYSLGLNYLKIQGLAFLVFLILSGISFGVIHLASYLFNLKRETIRKENQLLVAEVNTLFTAGKIDEAISRIATLHKNKPGEFLFVHTHDSLVHELERMAELHFANKTFTESLYYFQYLWRYETHGKNDILRKIWACQYNLRQYPEALETLKQLHQEQTWSLELIYQMGAINLNHLNNVSEARHYFTMGVELFRDNMKNTYGEAYMVMLDPANTPDVCFELYIAKAKTDILVKEYTQAVKSIDMALYLRPERAEGYAVRGLLNISRQRYKTACPDLAKAQTLGATDVEEVQKKYCR